MANHSILLNWKNKLSDILIRFQLTVVFAVLSCLSLMYLNHLLRHGVEMQGTTFFLMLYPLSAMVLSLMLQLWTEDMPNHGKGWIIQGCFHLFWLALCIFWATQYPLSHGQSIAVGVSIFAMLIGWVTLPFIRQDNDLPAINFLIKVKISAIIASLTSLVLFLGLLLLMQSFRFLFGMKINDPYLADTAIFSFSLIAPLLVLVQLPKGERKYSHDNWLQHKLGNSIIHFLLIPLHFAYLFTLYIYAVKILVTWQLPDGWVSWLVSVLMLLTVVIIGLLYPVNSVPNAKIFDRLLVRYLPVVVMPLLVLMTIGLVRRFNDYGVTISRLYLLLFNVWCYAVCIGLIVCRSRKVMWIATSFAVILLAVSLFPVNITSFTKQQLKKNVRELLAESRMTKLPMDQTTYSKLLQTAGYATAKQIDSKIEYLRNEFKKESTTGFLKEDVNTYGYRLDALFRTTKKEMKGLPMIEPEINGGNSNSQALIPIPQGYRSGVLVNEYNGQDEFKIEGNQLTFSTSYVENNHEIKNTFVVSISQLKQMGNTKKNAYLVMKNDKAQLVITNFTLINEADRRQFSFNGVLFIK